MNTIQAILLAISALSGYPAGRFIASKTTEELKAGKTWFGLIMIASFLSMIALLFLFRGDSLLSLIASFAFIFLLALASLTYKKKTKKRKE